MVPRLPRQCRDRHSGARHPATPQFHGPAWPGPYWDGARLGCTRAPRQPGQRGADGNRRRLWQPSAWDRQACPQLVPLASPRVSRLRCLSPCSAQSREPLGGQPDPLGPATPHGPGGPPQAGGISSPMWGPCPHSTLGTEHCQLAQDGPRCSILALGQCWSQWGHPARTVPAHSPPSTPPEIARLPPPRQLPAASSPLPTADPGGGKGGAGSSNPPQAHVALPAGLCPMQPPQPMQRCDRDPS